MKQPRLAIDVNDKFEAIDLGRFSLAVGRRRRRRSVRNVGEFRSLLPGRSASVKPLPRAKQRDRDQPGKTERSVPRRGFIGGLVLRIQEMPGQ